MTTFSTINDVIDYVSTALGDYASDFDVDGIARDITDWRDGKLTLIIDDPDERFWEIAEQHRIGVRPKAEFRAMREMLGVTQQRLADDLGVRVLSVKRWENPKYPQQAPDEAWALLDDLMAVQDSAVRAALAVVESKVDERGNRPKEVAIPYWSSQADYLEHHYMGDDGDWTEVNATNRRVASLLKWLGFEVRWVDGSDNVVPKQ